MTRSRLHFMILAAYACFAALGSRTAQGFAGVPGIGARMGGGYTLWEVQEARRPRPEGPTAQVVLHFPWLTRERWQMMMEVGGEYARLEYEQPLRNRCDCRANVMIENMEVMGALGIRHLPARRSRPRTWVALGVAVPARASLGLSVEGQKEPPFRIARGIRAQVSGETVVPLGKRGLYMGVQARYFLGSFTLQDERASGDSRYWGSSVMLLVGFEFS